MPQMTLQQAYELAVQHHQAGRLRQAQQIYRQILAAKPDHAAALHGLGVIAMQVGQPAIAADFLRRVIALRPDWAEAHYNLGGALHGQGLLDDAIAAYRRAIALNPSYAEAYCNLGNTLQDRGHWDDAIAAYRQALVLNPSFADACNNLGNTFQAKGQLDDATAAYRQALTLNPNYAEAHNNLGGVLRSQGQVDQAIAAFRQAVTLDPHYAKAHSNLLFSLHYRSGLDASAIAEEHRRWNQQHAEPLQKLIKPHANDRNSDCRLRIGYVSPDFHDHPVGRFILPLLAHHDEQQVEVFAYAQEAVPDALTERLRRHADTWRSLLGLSDAHAADLIRQDRVDILVDLTGHTGHNRLLVFAEKPAPVQVTYLGYPNTTALTTMDYRLTDAYADPPGQNDRYYSEQLLRLSPCAWCFAPPEKPRLTVRPPGPITFGCFNNFPKVTEAMLKLWGRILLAVPDSRLLLKSAGLATASVRQNVQQVLGGVGIAPDRLELHGQTPDYAGHLAFYEHMDIALDTFPYHGTTTTCEAMWMGVPVITLAGQSHVSRVGVSLLNNAGLPELVAESQEQYLQIAVALANDRPRLAQLRATLRPRMAASPLMDAPRFARNVEAAYRQMWRTYCAAGNAK